MFKTNRQAIIMKEAGNHRLTIPGSFECLCGEGFMLDEFTKTCIDINECLVDNGGCHHTCINTIGSRTCK